MKSVDTTTRTKFLSAVAEPESRIYIRRLRLDFGSQPIAMASTQLYGEDYYGKYILGDTCLDSADAVVRLANVAAGGQASDWFYARTTSPHTPANWEYSDAAAGPTVSAYCRPGIFPTGSSGHVYAWYAGTSDYVYRVDYNAQADSWGSPTSGLDVGSWDSIAVHPVGTDSAIIVGFTDPYLWLVFAVWSGSAWNSVSKHVVSCLDGVDPLGAAHFSGAVEIGSTGEYAVVLNMAPHGAVYSVRYDGASGVYSQPTLAAGANADWGGIQAFATGMSWINSRAWMVVDRAIESAGGEPQARHAVLMSSPDGKNWREEDYVGIYQCYGVPLVCGNYIYVAGNAVVYESDATIKVGVDNTGLLSQVDDASRWTANVGANRPAQIKVPGIRGFNSTLDDTLVEPGAEVVVQVRDSSGDWVDIVGGYMETRQTSETYSSEKEDRMVRGPISRLTGNYAFQHPLGMGFDSPISYYTDFTSEKANAKISVRQVTGRFRTEFNPETGKWELEGERGIALIPTSVRTPWMQAQMHAIPMQSLEGLYFILYYEDQDNYWRAGLQRDAGNTSYDLVIEQVAYGVATQRAINSSVGSSAEVEMSMFLSIKPGDITVKVNIDSSSDDYSSATSVSYDPMDDLLPVPMTHHMGIEIEGRKDFLGANKYGTVESATKSSLTDTGVFSTSDIGKWVAVYGQWRKIRSATANTIGVTPNFSVAPKAGMKFGVYPDNRGPYVRFRSFAMCDGNSMWTVGDVAESIVQMAGVNIVDKETTSVGALGVGDVYMYDVDISLSTACNVAIHATDGASPSYYSVEIDGTNSKVALKRYVAGTPTTVAVYPSLIDISDADCTFRVIHYRDNVYVYSGDHFVCAFWNVKTAGCGRVAASAGTATVSEFPSMSESFIWDAAKPASSAVASLLRGRPAKMIEMYNGAGSTDDVKVSRFESRDSLGTWATTVVQRGEGDSLAPSLVELEGEDTREYYLDPEQAREGIMFRRSKSEFARGTQQTRSELRRVVRMGKELSNPGNARLGLPDPAAQPEDEVAVNGVDYVIENIQVSAGYGGQGLTWGAVYGMRRLVPDVDGGVWNTDTWGNFKWG